MTLPLSPPLEPMLARLERELPDGDGWLYEPKWDGFRCLAFSDGDDVHLVSRNDRPLTRYFPEIIEPVRALGGVILDGELVMRTSGGADFVALMARLHPAASRVALLAGTTPADYIAFDLLADRGEDLTARAFAERRTRLEALLANGSGPLLLTPQTTDAAEAQLWLDAPAGSGIDGVVAKRVDAAYRPGVRAMTKVKRLRTADCVVAGLRVHADGGVASLLLGLYDAQGQLAHVGVASSFSRSTRAELRELLAPHVVPLEGHPWQQGFGLEGGALGRLKGTAGRWTPEMQRDWLPVRPDLVAEVGYDHVQGHRFRHPARLLRWRPDRAASSCTLEQLS